MARRLFTLCSALSLLLCIAVCALWVRSYRHGDKVGCRTARAGGATGGAGHDEIALSSYSGRLAVSRSGWMAPAAAPASDLGWFVARREPRPTYAVDADVAGFAYRRVTGPGRWLWEFRAPDGAVAALLLILPAVQLVRWRRQHRRAAAGLCPACGYDLRATPGRCPECGTAAAEVKP